MRRRDAARRRRSRNRKAVSSTALRAPHQRPAPAPQGLPSRASFRVPRPVLDTGRRDIAHGLLDRDPPDASGAIHPTVARKLAPLLGSVDGKIGLGIDLQAWGGSLDT